MKVTADLHVHGRFARACSKDLSIKKLEENARIKGVSLLGTGDCLQPDWIKEINDNLQQDENGILWTENRFPFLLQTEVSLVYTQGKKGRRIHHLVLIPSLEILAQIVEELKKKYRLDYDGRPIFGMSSIELVEKMAGISRDIEIIPAHAWTSWFGVFGSMSGFDSLEECFGEKTKHIHAIETGLSSDPAMNWRIKFLDDIALVSFSDLHSYWPWRLGREATVFDLQELTYKNIVNSIRTKRIAETIEFFPEEGKYHYDGHRNCNVSFSPAESRKYGNVCPNCGRQLTIGVLNRVEQLAGREEGFVPKDAVPFRSLVPLSELIAALLGTTPYSKSVWEIYSKLVKAFGNEFNVLLNAGREDLLKAADEKIADIILKNRNGELKIIPGYDGVYGKLVLSGSEAAKEQSSRKFKTLMDF